MTREQLAYEHAKSVGWNDAVKVCALIAQGWSDDAAEFRDDARCKVMRNICHNMAKAIRALDRSIQAIDD